MFFNDKVSLNIIKEDIATNITAKFINNVILDNFNLLSTAFKIKYLIDSNIVAIMKMYNNKVVSLHTIIAFFLFANSNINDITPAITKDK